MLDAPLLKVEATLPSSSTKPTAISAYEHQVIDRSRTRLSVLSVRRSTIRRHTGEMSMGDERTCDAVTHTPTWRTRFRWVVHRWDLTPLSDPGVTGRRTGRPDKSEIDSPLLWSLGAG